MAYKAALSVDGMFREKRVAIDVRGQGDGISVYAVT